jgi:hypothetical protein
MAFAENGKKFLPPEGKTVVFIGQDKKSVPVYVKHTGIEPGGITVYTSIQKADGIQNAANHGGGVQHAQYLMDLYPNSAVQVGLYMVGALDKVVEGKYDKNIKVLAKWFKSNKRPFYLRVGYEFDNPGNDYDPSLYKTAYRRIVDKLRAMEVKNVAFVWHSYGAKIERSLFDWYPGDDYVDWVGISFFGPYETEWRKDVTELARSLGKPLMIAEAAPMGLGVDYPHCWEIWYESVFRFIKENDIRIFCYINCNWDKIPIFAHEKWKDSSVQSNTEILANWVAKISSDDFLNASSRLFKTLGYY